MSSLRDLMIELIISALSGCYMKVIILSSVLVLPSALADGQENAGYTKSSVS
jgi:hypothetical protein